MLADQHQITHYIPQRPPMVMIDQLLEASDHHSVTRFTIASDNIFLRDGYFAEPGLVENIAQTAAAQVGYRCALKNIPVPIGFIASVKALKIVSLPLQNSSITTSVNVTNQILDITVVQGKVEQNGQVLCSCEMKIFVKI
ncbi:MAG: 3-hydroxyacyl-ACP dehydratase [Cyclobacteriaceae bacterium]|nr:3-hydroxyacyl-ACP dehydratase [Cyclobacteriaceae bacterium]